GRPDLADDPRLANNAGRVAHEQEIDAAIAAWTSAHPAAHVLATLDAASVPGGPINSVADMVADPHFNARGLFQDVTVDGRPLTVPAMAPLLAQTPGRTDRAGPKLGEHTDEVLGSLLGLSVEERARLRQEGAI